MSFLDDPTLFVHEITEGKYADSHMAVVFPMLYNDRLIVCPVDQPYVYVRAFCFPKEYWGSTFKDFRGKAPARTASHLWNGEGDPPGPWIKEVGTDRYGPGLPRDKQRDNVRLAGCKCEWIMLEYETGIGPYCKLCGTKALSEVPHLAKLNHDPPP